MQQMPSANMVQLTYLIYGLHLFSAVNGVLTSAFIVTAFLSGWPSIIAVLLNYIKREDMRGTYLDSHFRWQKSRPVGPPRGRLGSSRWHDILQGSREEPQLDYLAWRGTLRLHPPSRLQIRSRQLRRPGPQRRPRQLAINAPPPCHGASHCWSCWWWWL